MSVQQSKIHAYRSIAIACTLALVAGAVTGYLTTDAPTANRLPAHGINWILPDVTKMLDGNPAALGILLQHDPFGAGNGSLQPATTKTVKAEGMQLVGIVEVPQRTALFYSLSSGKLLRVGAGDQLPDYGVIRGIANGVVTIKLNGCEKTVQLFSQVAPVLDGCTSKHDLAHNAPQKSGNRP